MKKLFDKEKINRIPNTVIGVAIVAVIAVIAVVLAELDTWYSVLISVCSIILIVIISIVLIRWELKRNVKGVLESQRMEAEKQAMDSVQNWRDTVAPSLF
mgnify:CR=1 FL=1